LKCETPRYENALRLPPPPGTNMYPKVETPPVTNERPPTGKVGQSDGGRSDMRNHRIQKQACGVLRSTKEF